MSIPAWIPIVTSLVSAAVSLGAFAYQVYRARFNQSIELLLKFEADFFGEDMRNQRSTAARLLRHDPPDFTEVEDVLDFFETIALMSRKHALDRYMVWHTFFYWLDRYYEIAKPHIEARRRTDTTVWQDIGPFVQSLRKLQVKEGHLSSVDLTIPDQHELARFLSEEQTEGTPISRSTISR